ncbi:MAG: gamma-glutamylcyclotransferase [Myxococcota bacterium]|nr:gamma-glutamylcyclotransferase [Myxococcota bacterium]
MRELYFAYGSNLSTRRLAERIPNPRPVAVAQLDAHRLVFNKPSADGSGKANLIPEPGSVAWGVVWSIPATAWTTLDGFEPGYRRTSCRIHDGAGQSHCAQVYLFEAPGTEQLPYAGYVEHLLEGAREHGLPETFVRFLTGVRTRPDPVD